MLALPQGAALTAPMPVSPPTGTPTATGWRGRNLARWLATPIGPIPGPPPPMRMQNVLWRFDMANVGAAVGRAAEPHLRVEVGPVEVHLAAVLVDDRANALDLLFEDPVRRRVGDHDRREACRVLLRFRLEVSQVDVALLVARDDDATHIPAIAADAGFVPCALAGMRQTSRRPSPRASLYARMTSKPASSPLRGASSAGG